MSSQRVCKRGLVSGRVQGVFYRATAVSRARELSIDGYARNLPDGRVEVLACGNRQAVDSFVQWLWTGSSASKVTAVDVEMLDPSQAPTGSGFRSR